MIVLIIQTFPKTRNANIYCITALSNLGNLYVACLQQHYTFYTHELHKIWRINSRAMWRKSYEIACTGLEYDDDDDDDDDDNDNNNNNNNNNDRLVCLVVSMSSTNYKCGLGLEWDPPSLVRIIG